MKTALQNISKNSFFLAIASFFLLTAGNAYALSAVAQQIQGEVLMQKAGSSSWNTLSQDTSLENGDSIKTQKGSCILTYSDQAAFTLEENTSLTIEERTDAQDIKLILGKIKGKVNKQKAEQPFVVSTPAAVATVRGTNVDFSFDEQGQLIVDLHNGKIDVINADAEFKADLEGKKSIVVKFNKEANSILIKNNCESDGAIQFSILGAEYSQNPCEEKEISLSTGEQGTSMPGLLTGNTDQTENIDEGREPISPTTN